MDNSGKVLSALLIGAAAGAITGLLLAPESGDKTRRKLNKSAKDLMDDLEDAWEDSAEKIKDLADSAVEEIEKYNKKINS
ncbi:gas vesicle protein [Catalinimonas alkaloidigena]|uniref:YtxH domain-containing protein n=1 Tax=Catalinimonas alkaloidigena TaxID=1075417 RepID=UPI0024061CC4|nr:YtxH domain-containing protein [Catalinimonas alkaloidigena]MDF9795126.1 gas vesicle protein [Catalinimonas alkaloidigena]